MIFTIRTTVAQESLVIDVLSNRIKNEDLNIYSLCVVPGLKGYVLIEADNEITLRRAIANMPHIKGKGVVSGDVKIDELSNLLESKPLMKSIKQGMKVEIIAGPFKGEKARVKRVDELHEEITVELFEAMVPIPVTVRGDNVRVLRKEDE